MPLIDTDKIAQQFGQQTKEVIENLASNGLGFVSKIESLLETKDLVITTVIQLKSRQ